MRISLGLLVLVLAILTAAVGGAPEEKPKELARPLPDVKVLDIDGYYEVRGESYLGVALIQRKADVYLMRQMVGSAVYTGVGMRDAEGAVVFGWNNGQMTGVTAYQIKAGPTLVGEWTSVPGNGSKTPETLTFLKAIK